MWSLSAATMLVATGASAGVREYRDRALGDQAFNDHDYPQAVRFYRRYLEDAGKDETAGIDASRRLVSALLRDDHPGEALAVYRQLKLKLGHNADVEDRLVEIEVLTAGGKLAEAKTRAEELLHSINQEGNEYIRALDLLGNILLRMQRWQEAENVYALLERSVPGTPWEYRAFCRRVYAMIMSGNYKEAGKALTLNLRIADSPEKTEAKGLSLLLLLKENRLKEFAEIYPTLRQSLEVLPNAVCYEAMMLAHDKFLAAGNGLRATAYLADAFGYAPDAARRKQVLRQLIDEYVKAGKPTDAATACTKYLDYYRNAPEAPTIRMELAAILFRQGKYDEAIAAYTLVMNNPAVELKLRLTAAKSIGSILATEKKYAAAAKAFEFIRHNGITKDEQAEGMVLQGQSYYNQELYRRAIFTLREAAESSPHYRPLALHWIMRNNIRLKEYDAATKVLEELNRLSCSRELQAENAYYAGYILDQTGQSKTAGDAYERYARNFPDAAEAPTALFRAGELALTDQRFAVAARIFADFSSRYAGNKLEPAALYKQVYALFCADNAAAAVKITAHLNQSFPASPYTVAADFWEVDYTRDQGDYPKAEALLEAMSRRFASRTEVLHQILY
ncbi:MAG: tetratricopeptide repeat protein, partial [Victivallales bacterium]|nr:tetratricopeptide repeat protein [Victivallales bacterium]